MLTTIVRIVVGGVLTVSLAVKAGRLAQMVMTDHFGPFETNAIQICTSGIVGALGLFATLEWAGVFGPDAPVQEPSGKSRSPAKS